MLSGFDELVVRGVLRLTSETRLRARITSAQ
jgi:hypothetical protein